MYDKDYINTEWYSNLKSFLFYQHEPVVYETRETIQTGQIYRTVLVLCERNILDVLATE